MNRIRFMLGRKGLYIYMRKGYVRKSGRWLLGYLAIGMAFLLLSGCKLPEETKSATAPDGSPKLQVVTTIFPPYDFARQIGGAYVEVHQLLKPGMEAHSYEPSPRDIIRIMESDLFLYAGGESDVWVEEILSSLDGEFRSCSLLGWVEPLEEEMREGMQVRGEHPGHGGEESHEQIYHGKSGSPEGNAPHEGNASYGKEAPYGENALHGEEEHRPDEAPHEGIRLDGEYDEHVWTAPANAILLVEQIRDEMIASDPSRAEIYRTNAEQYLLSLRELEKEYADILGNAQRKVLLFADRFPFLYLVRSYGLDYYAAFPGCSPETEPSASTIAFLTDRVREEGFPLILYLESSNGKIALAIGEVTDTQIAVLHSCHTLTREEEEAGETYLSLMKENLKILDKALNGRSDVIPHL